ncbi:thiol:disulfide interchange protein [Paludibacter sp. 221]|uniref:protein-disulfide reductase DsbD family protein n=1 Tax=Paludibacter sp. 221 TaxID=2302939 RepID=UPI0013D6C6FC|nr:cytochrome c biogenesis protein CcdA [Paludibacter sp. 221]NDV47919.1 thiol:disulfide interchange protein [Paludibacter sp. 221]
MKKKFLFFFISLCAFFTLSAQIYEPIKWNIEHKVTGENTADIIFHATIDKGWHLYGLEIPDDGPRPTNIVFNELKNVALSGEVQAKSKLIRKYDVNFAMELNWYDSEAVFIQSVTFDSAKEAFVEGHVEYMACNDQTCLPPTQEPFEISINEQVANAVQQNTASTQAPPSQEKPKATAPKIVVQTPQKTEPMKINEPQQVEIQQPAVETNNDTAFSKYWTPVIADLQEMGEMKSSDFSLWWIFLVGFLGGLLALITPCVWPVIPMTVSFFLKRSQNKASGRRDAVLYGLAIIIIYVLLGLFITLIFGASALNDLSTNAVFNLFLFALLVIFAISFFGAFEITLPAKWTTKMDAKAESTAGFISILFMAFTLVLVSFSCTGPIIGFLLVEVSSSGSILAPLIGMLGFAVALAIPFSLFAFFPTWLKSLPKSGGWLNKVKVVLAFIELAFALKFLSVADLAYGWHILDREVFIVLWVVIFALLGFYLLGKLRFPHDSETKHTSIPGVFLAIISLAFAIYLIPGLWGAPLKAASAFLPPLYTQDFNLNTDAVHADFTDYDEGMRYAAAIKKTVVVDFSGYGCVNCRKMEAKVWTDPRVKDALEKDYVLITLYVDDKTQLDEPFEVEENGRVRKIKTIGDKWSYLQRSKFGANAQPFYVILDNEGKPLNKSYAYDEDPVKFLNWLKLK